MKADHRHELKTNELAEWITHFPEWARENRATIIGVSVVIVAVAAVYFWQFYRKNVVSVRSQLRLTSLLSQLTLNKMQVIQAQSEGRDLSFILLQPAENLKVFAQDTKDKQMAALALIKRAEALRTELHYRLGAVSQQDLVTQMKQAKASYAEALEKASSNPSLKAMAQFGLGICEEELGNFEQARQIYQDVAMDPDFDGTEAKAAAKHRLDTMANYQTSVVFRPSPKLAPPVVFSPLELKPAEVNLPADTNLPLSLQPLPEGPNIVPLVPDEPAVEP
jgi:tetratricopeptide (TPR) repeat protein